MTIAVSYVKIESMLDATLGFGLIGLGAWEQFHADTIAKTRGAGLLAIAARSSTSRNVTRQAILRAHNFVDYWELLFCPDIDVVDIVAPRHFHHKNLSELLAARKQLLGEQSMILSP